MNNAALQVLYISNGVFVFAGALLVPFYALFAENVGASLVTVGALSSVLFISKLFGLIVVRICGDKIIRKEWMVAIGFLLRASGWLGLVFLPTIPGLFMMQIVLGFGDGIGSPAFRALFAMHLDRGHEVFRYSNWEIILTAAAATSAMAGGFIISHFGFSALFISMSILAIAATILLLMQSRHLTVR